MHGRIYGLGFVCFILMGGCAEPPLSPPDDEPPVTLGESFDAAATGTIRGRVTWDGDVPAAQESLVRAIAFNPHFHQKPARFSTPHIPKMHPQTRGVENAIVFLRGIDPRRSRAWDHPPARVEFHDRQLLIQQGNLRTSVGFVRRGAAIEIVNRDTEYHNLHARGAGFFATPLIEANQVHEPTLAQVGVVDLTCGAGFYWLHAHLFVTEHPYYVRTDANGDFLLEQVPTGTYEVVCWLPSWHVAGKEVEPERGIINRLSWEASQEQTRQATVRTAEASQITYAWSQTFFAKK